MKSCTEGSKIITYLGYKDYPGCSIELGLDGIILEAERPVKRIVPRSGDDR